MKDNVGFVLFLQGSVRSKPKPTNLTVRNAFPLHTNENRLGLRNQTVKVDISNGVLQ